MLKDNDTLGIENIRYVMDKEFFSKRNLQYFKNKGLKIIILTSFTVKYSNELIIEYPKYKMTNSKNRLAKSEMFAITVDSNKYGIDSNIHVLYYSQQKDMDETNRLFEKIDKLEEQLNSLKTLPKDLKKYDKYFKIGTKDDHSFTFSRNEDEIKKKKRKNLDI